MRNWIVGIVAGLVVCAATAPALAAAPLPVIYNSAYGFAHSSPTASPPGATISRASRAPLIPAP